MNNQALPAPLLQAVKPDPDPRACCDRLALADGQEPEKPQPKAAGGPVYPSSPSIAPPENNMIDTELILLEKISQAQGAGSRITQRALASACGLSVGMINVLVHRFSEQGLIRLTRRSTKSVEYSLTPAGISEKEKRATGNYEMALRSADRCREALEAFILKAKANGATTLVLAGQSELDYLIASICERTGIVFVRSADPDRAESLARRPGVVAIEAGGTGFPSLPSGVLLSSIVVAKENN